MSTFDAILSEICRVASTLERKSTQELALKTGEETGELQQAVLSVTEAPGCKYKNKTWEDVDEEAVDVVICALATCLKGDGNLTKLLPIFEKKIQKWKEVIG